MFAKGIDSAEKLVRPPKGYEESNPAIEYLKLKGFVVSRRFDDDMILSKAFSTELSRTFKAAKPLVDFINRSFD